ncbi:HPF/RaiA family ribosome-associated protein [Kribbella solani]|uniref:Ribosome-associated translation inhibitor RaiA n=1 Tax=Kribbella solani TaxID=236067 RepID=A0A841DP93_9ACTN|nr:HPF/RaiA family ribosome-associated protein [Kribbella solani]MBB5978500.1 ribosome-associated translation inhibitor RaiA [Kribbella solani]
MTNVQMTVRGEVSEQDAGYALGKIQHAVSRTPSVDRIHVVLTVAANPANEAPATVEAAAAVGGVPLHVHASAASLIEAVDEAADRLRRQFTDLRERARSGRRAKATVVVSSAADEGSGERESEE